MLVLTLFFSQTENHRWPQTSKCICRTYQQVTFLAVREGLPWWRDGISHIEMVTHFVPTWSGCWANPGGSISETGVWSVRCLTTNLVPPEQMDISRKWSEVAQLCLTLCDPMDCSPPGSSIHGIFQARVLEWVASSFSRGSSRPRDWTWISRIVGRHFTVWATRMEIRKVCLWLLISHLSQCVVECDHPALHCPLVSTLGGIFVPVCCYCCLVAMSGLPWRLSGKESAVQSLGQEDPLEEGMATHSSHLAWRIPMERGAWWATALGVTKIQMWLKWLSSSSSC